MFRLNWTKLWGQPQRSPVTAAPEAPVVTTVAVAAPAPARERPASSLSALALAGNDFIAEEDVDRATLGDLLSRAFMRVSYDSDGSLWAQDYDATRVMITVDAVRRSIRMAAAWRYKPASDAGARQRLAARTNDTFVMVRFRVVEPDLLVADYFLPYERGLLAAQLVHALKQFGRIAQSAVREHDGEDVLQ